MNTNVAFLENKPSETVHDILELIRIVARKDGRGVPALVDVVLIADRLGNAFETHDRRMLSRNDCGLNPLV